MWVDRVELAGVELDLDECLADVVIRHGRTTIDDGPTSSTLQMTLLEVGRGFTSAFRVGVPLTVDADGVRRFTGTVTDAALDDDRLTVIAAGPLSTLSRYPVGAAGWPAEAWHLRVERAFTEAGLSSLLLLDYDEGFDPVLLARDPGDPVDLYSYLSELAETLGAAIVDTPDGRVFVQELNARTSEPLLSWDATPSSLAWNEVDAGVSWEEATTVGALDPSAPPTFLPIDPADVAYVPVWEMVDTVENVSTVEYGDDLAVTVSEPASIALYGERPGSISTAIAGEADASRRATERVGRRAFPRWTIGSAALLTGYPLTVGQVVELDEFPNGSPFETWSPVLEGWTDTITGDVWTCELSLSDPLLSGVVVLWATTPADLAWNEVDPATAWNEATSLGSLTTLEASHA